jgi:hypothetical protein
MKNKQFGTVIGTYGKGIEGSATVNFTVSGGKHCDDSCSLKGAGCYAEQTGKVKPSITVNLEKKEADFSGYLATLATPKGLEKIRTAPWVRFAAFGSVPVPSSWTNEDRANWTKIAEAAESHGRYHFPIETVEKARALKALGFSRVRVSDGASVEARLNGFPVSIVVQGAKRATGKNKRAHAAPAFEKAKQYRARGVNAKVCPAIAGSAKCGSCTLCADNDVAIVIYPMH